MEVIGYHGTEKSSIDSINRNGYNYSTADNWLGAGIYFFGDKPPIINGEMDAKNWAKNHRKFENIAVFCAQIESDKYIDLIENEMHKSTFKEIKDIWLDKHLEGGGRRETFKESKIFLHLLDRYNFDFILAIVSGNTLTNINCRILFNLQLQICVINNSCIKNNHLKYVSL